MHLGHVGQSGTRLSTTQRIISPASSVNHYPHLKGNGNEIISAAGSQRNSVYQFKLANGGNANNQVIPISYANSRSVSNQGHIGPAGNQEEIVQRLNSHTNVVNQSPAHFQSVMSNISRQGPAYGTNDEHGEPISVKGHLTDLEVSFWEIRLPIE